MRHNRKKRKQQITEERISPTPERLAKGDIAYTDAKTYRCLTPTMIDRWRETGFLGTGQDNEDRLDAMGEMMELAEAAGLTSLGTMDMDVFSPTTGGGADVTALDMYRFVLGRLSRGPRRVVNEIALQPLAFHRVDRMVAIQAADELRDALEHKIKTIKMH